jgi:hypothetical protein
VPGNSDVVAFSQAIPDTGHALVKFTLNLRAVGDASLGVHGWAGTGYVGDPGYPRQMSWGAGEDLCPGESLTKYLAAYGNLTPASPAVSFAMHEYRSTACQNGVVVVSAGSTVDVWVEDASAGCQDRDIVLTSYFRTIWDAHGVGANVPVALNTNITDMVQATIDTSSSGRLRVLGQTEISPAATANQCGNRFETGFAYVHGSQISQVVRGGFAPSGGMSHVLISPEIVLEAQPAGTYTVGLASGVDQVIRDGALAGATFSGDTFLALISERSPPPPSSMTGSCTANTAVLSWPSVPGATYYEVVFYVPIGESCPSTWTDLGTSTVNQNRACLGTFSANSTSASVQRTAAYVAYVASVNSAGASAFVESSYFSCH